MTGDVISQPQVIGGLALCCVSRRVPAWVCKEDHEELRCKETGEHGQHCEEWRYRTSLETALGLTVLELVVYTPHYKHSLRALNADRFNPAGLNLHQPYPPEREDIESEGVECDYLGGRRCWGTDCRGLTWLQDRWNELAGQGAADLPFERDGQFWAWMASEHVEAVRDAVDARTVWQRCTCCGHDGPEKWGWVRK